MNMSTWAIRRPVPVLALFLVLMVSGIFSFGRLPVTQFPNIDFPIITISVYDAGAAPADVVNQIIKPIESVVSDIAGVKHVTSVANDSSARITIQFELSTKTDRALTDVKDAVAGVQSTLPATANTPVIKRLDVTGQPILVFSVRDETQSIEELSYFVDNTVARDLQAAPGIGKVTRIGGANREIRVNLDPDRLRALNLTAAEVNNQLRANNINLGSGRGDLAGQEYSIRTLGAAQTVQQLKQMPITLPGGSTVRLGDLGSVVDGSGELRSFAMFDNEPVVALAVFRASGFSDLTAGDNAKARIAALGKKYPNVKFSLIDDATVYTRGSFISAMETLYEGAALAVIVVFLFLRDWRATLITAIAMPLSIIPTFLVMDLLGFSLNTVSLLGITLVTGILVDDAIVEIENIVRHIQMGKTAYKASKEAATEIGLTVIAISFTIVAVFAPVSFMSGIAGQYFKQFGLTVAVAVLFSLLVARLITPMVSAYFLRDGTVAHLKKDGLVMRSYMRILGWTLRNRTITLILGLAIFTVSIYSATLLPTQFIPPADTGRTIISLELPPGSTIQDTRRMARRVTDVIGKIPEVTNIFVDAGQADNGAISKATITVNYGQKSTRTRSSFQIQAEIRRLLTSIPDARLYVLKENGKRALSLNVLGDTEAAASSAAQTVARQMNALPDIINASTTAALPRPEIRIRPKPELAAELGVTATALANTIRIATIGASGSNVAKFNAGDRQIPIVVRLNEAVRRDLFRMAGERVPRKGGKPIPLGVVADVSLASGASSIERYDRKYRVSVDAGLARGAVLGPATAEIATLPITKAMPKGTSIQPAGDAQVMGEVFSSFGLAMGAGMMLVYVVLVLLFSSFVTPITILLSLPLAIGGAIFALYLDNSAIGLSVVIGFLMLMGIVTKNAIMLVEFGVEAMQQGMAKHKAMLEAGHKRARPIVMTTIAMTAGMVPSALAIGPGGEFRAPMAIAVIGGLLLSTLLSLLFVPSLFSVIDGLKGLLRRLLVVVLGMNAQT